MIDSNAIREQSKAAYKQWAEQWREHCKENAKVKTGSFDEYMNIGVGKAVLCVANGYTFEENIETIKKYQGQVDIMACDKTLGNLLDHGITPTYVVICDANVNYEKYMEKWKDKLSKTTLFMSVQANPKWAKNGNWKNIVMFVNRDIIDSHLEFSKLSGCNNFLVAGTNVSNAMVIVLTQSDNEARNNLFGYDKILLIGFDYSWRFDKPYYAFDKDGGGKHQYMRHSFIALPNGEFGYTSGNLTFSMEWLRQYVKTFNLPVIQCSKASMFQLNGNARDLAEQMQYAYKTEDRLTVKTAVHELRKLKRREQDLINTINNIGRDHYWAFARSI